MSQLKLRPFAIYGRALRGIYGERRLTYVAALACEAERDELIDKLRREHPEQDFIARNPDDRDRNDGRRTT